MSFEPNDSRGERRGRRVTYRPGKTSGVMAIVVGVIFVGIGIFEAIPLFGGFGILWTLFAGAISIVGAYQAFGKKYSGPEIHIEDDTAPRSPDAAQRLRDLTALLEQGLITQEEFEQKRQEILREL